MENSINSVYKKLIKCEFPSIKFDSKNPHFKNEYASLDSILTEVIPVLRVNGLCLTQPVINESGAYLVRSTVTDPDTSDFIHSDFPILSKDVTNPQAMGSGVTYAKRYSISALLGIRTGEDDDGHVATKGAINNSSGSNTKTHINDHKQINEVAESKIDFSPSRAKYSVPGQESESERVCSNEECIKSLSPDEYKYSIVRCFMPLCRDHQKGVGHQK